MDFSRLAQNLGLEDDEFMELVVLLVDNGRSTLSELEACWSRGDVEGARKAAHTFKGASGNLGFVELHTCAQTLERAITAQAAAEVDSLLTRLKGGLEALASRLETDPY